MIQHFFKDTFKRFFFLYGNTEDDFCSADLKLYHFEKFLFYHLKSLGYDIIAFYNAKYKIFTYEKSSYDLILNPNIANTAKYQFPSLNSLIPKGPLGMGNVLLNKKVTDVNNSEANIQKMGDDVYSFGSMTEMDVVAKLDQLMHCKNCKTVIVFTDGMDFFNNFADNATRQMAANLSSWLKFGHTNENICIFSFPNLPNDQLMLMIQRRPHWQFLYSKMFAAQGRLSDTSHFISYPQSDEISNLINYYRLKYNYKIDWEVFEEYLEKIAAYVLAEKKTLKELGSLFKDAKEFSADFFHNLAGKRNNKLSATQQLEQMRGIDVIKDKIDDLFFEIKELSDQDIEKTAKKNINPFFTHRTTIPQDKKNDINLHLALKGAPGTGKTTVARLIGEIFREKGLLRSGHFVKASRSDLVAGYVGQTAIQTSRLIDQAMGGVLFVDEAYSLVGKGDNDFGQEALETILEAMENHKGEFAVIFAGYPDEIDSLIESNPGFKSRFSEHHIISIPNFNHETLYQILLDTIAEKNKILNWELREQLPVIIERWQAAEGNNKSFGNARTIKEDIYKAMDNNRRKRVRITNDPAIDDKEFIMNDLPSLLYPYIAAHSSNSFDSAMEELDKMIGLNGVKHQIDKLIKQIELNKMRAAQNLKSSHGNSMHMLFVGNPGTGKTTVARLMGEILKGLNIIPSSKVVEVSPKDLVAAYVGQSEQKAQEKLDEAKDGILFIDEIYGLSSGSLGNSYGADVITNVLVPAMTKQDSDLVIIGAGYEKQMEEFLNNNPGLDRRFSKKILFEDFSNEELLEIIQQHAIEQDYVIPEALKEPLINLFNKIRINTGSNFGNAGVAVRCFDNMCENLGARLINQKIEYSVEDLTTFTIADIPDVNINY